MFVGLSVRPRRMRWCGNGMQLVDDLGGTARVGRAWWWYKGKRDLIIDPVHTISASRVNDPFDNV